MSDLARTDDAVLGRIELARSSGHLNDLLDALEHLRRGGFDDQRTSSLIRLGHADGDHKGHGQTDNEEGGYDRPPLAQQREIVAQLLARP